MDVFDVAMEIIRKKTDQCDFLGEIGEELVEKAENFLGLRFPDDYRKFILNFGTCCIESTEIYGITSENFTSSSVPNAIWVTFKMRNNSEINKNMVVIESLGDGDYHVIDCGSGATMGRIFYYMPIKGNDYYEEVYGSFGDYLLSITRIDSIIVKQYL